jgi:hypothetical protein
MWFKNSVEIRSQVAPKKYVAFLMINAYKKFKNKKFKKVSRRDPFRGHLLMIFMSKISLTFTKMEKKNF